MPCQVVWRKEFAWCRVRLGRCEQEVETMIIRERRSGNRRALGEREAVDWVARVRDRQAERIARSDKPMPSMNSCAFARRLRRRCVMKKAGLFWGVAVGEKDFFVFPEYPPSVEWIESRRRES